MSDKLLTIAIATYNMERYISRCIDSILVPSVCDEIEILVLNDGSKDRSSEIAHQYSDKYPNTVKVVDKENGGYGSAINMAIDVAQGKYFKTLDADDWFNGDALVEFVTALRNIDVDLVISHYSREHEVSGDSIPVKYSGIEFSTPYDFTDFCIYEKTGFKGFAMHAMAYKTDVLRKDNFRMSHCYYSDVDYSVYPLVNVNTVLFLDVVLYKYLVGREDQSVSFSGLVKHFDDHMYITCKLLDYYTKHQANNPATTSLNIGYNAVQVMTNVVDVMCSALYYSDRKRAKNEIASFKRYIKGIDHDLRVLAKEHLNMRLKFIRYERRVILKKKVMGIFSSKK